MPSHTVLTAINSLLWAIKAKAAVESRLKNVSITDFKAQYEAALGNARMSSLENNEQLLEL